MKRILQLFAVGAVCMVAVPVSGQETEEVSTVISADFSIFTEGSPEAPVDFPSYGTGSFTSFFSGWSVSKVAQAGGSLLMRDGATVRTNYVNLSANGGTFRVTMELRAMDDYGGAVNVQVGYSTTETLILAGDQWETVELVMSGGTSYTTLTVSPFLAASGVLVKSLVVEQSESFIAAPVATQPTSATTDEFTATWKKVSGATEYFLDVYSYAEDGQTKEYFLEDESCGTSTSKVVTGLDASKTYYYVVRASNGTGVSADSNEIEVVAVISSIDAPEISGTSADGSFTLSWEPVANARYYEVSLYSNRTLTEAGESEVLTEDFSLVNVGTFSSVDFNVNNLDKWTHIPGWDGPTFSLALSSGMMVIDNYGSLRYLATPEIDLSANDGACTVAINMAEAQLGSFYEGGTVSIAIVTYTAGDEDYTVVDSKDVVIDASDFKTYTVDLSGGTDACRIRISTTADHRIYIDDIAVTQILPAGAIQRNLVSTTKCYDTTFTGSFEPTDNTIYSATVTAVGQTVSAGEIVEIHSYPSNEVAFSQSGVKAGKADKLAGLTVCKTASSSLAVTTPQEANVNIYDLTGRLVANRKVAAGTTEITVGTSGMVIVVVGGEAFKIRL